MSALVVSELRRAVSRRLVKVLAAAGLLAAVVIGIVAFVKTSDPNPYTHLRMQDLIRGTSGILALVGLVIGASLIGAEHQSRALTTTLTFAPRRGRVFAAKAGTALAVAAAFSLATLSVISVALLPAAILHAGPTVGQPGWGTLIGVVLRGGALAGIAAGIGFALASVGRNTAAALGIAFAYIMVIENILGSSLKGWRSFLLLGNTIVWVTGKTVGDVPGRSVLGAGILLSAVAGVLLLGSAAAFRARDVA